MVASVSIEGNQASSVAAQVRHDRAKDPWFADLVKNLWPIKGSAAVEQYTRCPDRTARAYASGDREPPASVLRDLLRGDEGFRVLTYVMHGSAVTWWAVVQHERELAAMARNIFNQLETVMK